MTYEWEKPVKAVLDYFHLDDVTLMGYSLGGCLAIRAAAYESRVKRVITDDILTDFFEVTMRQLSAAVRTELSLLLKAGASGVVNTLLEQAMKHSLVAQWGIQHGMHVTGTRTPYEFFKQTQFYRTDDVSPLIEQDVLLMAGAEDHYVPLHQFYDQIRSLSQVRSLTARLFSRQEQAQNHVQVGNIGLSLRVITDWIESVQSKNQ
jgi:pimeloyl-ACP methyl ester carboxylesterase